MELQELETIVMELKDKIDNIVNSAKDAEDKFNHDKSLAEFTERNSESLGKYADKMKKLNGDDFDIYSAAFDEYNNDFSDVEEATYITQLVSEIDNKIAALKEALNDDHVMIESDGDETKVETHDEVIEAESEKPEEKEEEIKEDAEESVEEKSEEEKSEEDEDDKAEEDFVKELEEDYEKYHR